MYYHVVATKVGGATKTIPNKSEDAVITDFIVPYVSTGTIKAKWGSRTIPHQVVDMKVFKTDVAWDKKSGTTFDDFVAGKRSVYNTLAKRARNSISTSRYRCFVVMPIQGDKFGTQHEQYIWNEFNARFDLIANLLSNHDTVAIRIDREHAMENLVSRIKSEIRKADFVVTDLTDERPSCYFEAGYAEALSRPVIYVASKESVISPTTETKIHFDIHMNINFFSNHDELQQKMESVIEKNARILFRREDENDGLAVAT